MKFWTLVADRCSANIYESSGKHGILELVESIDHPEGRLREGDINSDKPGRSDNAGRIGRSAFSTEESATDHLLDQFVKTLSELLARGLRSKRYEGLRIAAEPRFLGRLRMAMSKEVSERIQLSINKELSALPQRELGAHIERAQNES